MAKKLFILSFAVISALGVAGEHLQARNCEVFIDQLGASGNGGMEGSWMHVILKVYPNRLDAPVKRIGTSVGGDMINRLSEDTYDVILYAVGTQPRSFFVETVKGTYYWVNRSFESGQPLTLDARLFESVKNQGQLSFIKGAPVRLIRPADYEVYSFGAYNPKLCR